MGEERKTKQSKLAQEAHEAIRPASAMRDPKVFVGSWKQKIKIYSR